MMLVILGDLVDFKRIFYKTLGDFTLTVKKCFKILGGSRRSETPLRFIIQKHFMLHTQVRKVSL